MRPGVTVGVQADQPGKWFVTLCQGTAFSWMPPEQAELIARLLCECARAIPRGGPPVCPPHCSEYGQYVWPISGDAA